MADDEGGDTAEPPKRSFKRTVAGTVEGRSPGFLLASLALGMVIALLFGLAIGITIGNNDDNASASPTTRPKPTPTSKPAIAALRRGKGPLAGTIVQSRPKALVVAVLKRRVPLVLVPQTTIEVTSAATSADIKAGSHVIFVLRKATGTTTTGTATTTAGAAALQDLRASEILIVSGTRKRRIGTEVSSATADSMTFTTAAGKSLTVSTAGAKVLRTIPGAPVNLKVGRRILGQFLLSPPAKAKANAKAKAKGKKKVAKRHRIATEVIVLPVKSALS